MISIQRSLTKTWQGATVPCTQ